MKQVVIQQDFLKEETLYSLNSRNYSSDRPRQYFENSIFTTYNVKL